MRMALSKDQKQCARKSWNDLRAKRMATIILACSGDRTRRLFNPPLRPMLARYSRVSGEIMVRS